METEKFQLLGDIICDQLIKAIDNHEPLNTELKAAVLARCAAVARSGDISEISPKFYTVLDLVRGYWHSHVWPEDFEEHTSLDVKITPKECLFIYHMGILQGCTSAVYQVIYEHNLKESYEENIDQVLKYKDVFEVIKSSTDRDTHKSITIDELSQKTGHTKAGILTFVTAFQEYNFFYTMYWPEKGKDGEYHEKLYFLGLTQKGEDALEDLNKRTDPGLET